MLLSVAERYKVMIITEVNILHRLAKIKMLKMKYLNGKFLIYPIAFKFET
jgi:hypothetical protein